MLHKFLAETGTTVVDLNATSVCRLCGCVLRLSRLKLRDRVTRRRYPSLIHSFNLRLIWADQGSLESKTKVM
jgi:hypothetical protein